MGDSPDLIDAEELVGRYSVEELAATAEQYFASVSSPDYLHAKPIGSVSEAPTILSHLAAMLSALELSSGMDVLDFGAGSCWTTRVLTQLGCRAIAIDVSATALRLGAELFERVPVVGAHVAPQFLHFDGHRFDLLDESVDRISCMDAFHHVPNRDEVLREMCRVLRPGGRAVLAEGGPNHSRTPQAQAEMRSYVVVERDIVVESFAHEVTAAGFADLMVGLYAGTPTFVPAQRFEHDLAHGEVAAGAARSFHANHRLLVLRKAGEQGLDSRRADALGASLTVTIQDAEVARVRVANTGRGRWLGAGVGEVNLGIHLFGAEGNLIDLDFHRAPVVVPPATHVMPGESVEFDVRIPPLPPGRHVLEFDLVAEGVAWFAMIGLQPVRHQVDIDGFH